MIKLEFDDNIGDRRTNRVKTILIDCDGDASVKHPPWWAA
jgi:hypothetical protein